METFNLMLIDVSQSPFIIILGRRGSGKTTLIRDLLSGWEG
jgi:ABC-type lipoprotein export system ATPase subunit